MNSFTELFDSVKKYCLENKKVPNVAITTWLNPLTPVSFDGENAVFSVLTEFQQDIVMNKYAETLKEAFFEMLGLNINIIINVASNTTWEKR